MKNVVFPMHGVIEICIRNIYQLLLRKVATIKRRILSLTESHKPITETKSEREIEDFMSIKEKSKVLSILIN